MTRAPLALALLLLGAAAPSLSAQRAPRGRIEGEITDSVHARKLANALVTATRIAPEPGQFYGTFTDERGHYRFDTLAAGQYQVSFVAPFLDSIEVVLPSRDLTLAEGEQRRLDMATPSGATFREAACPGIVPGRGAITGEVIDADTERPIPRARLAVAWTDFAVDRTTLRVQTTRQAGAVTADSLGRFWLCGVATGTPLFVQVQEERVAGTPIELVIDDSLGIVKRRLSLSRADARRHADTTVVAGADTILPRPLTGTATLTGRVIGPAGNPIGGASVRVVDAASSAMTDSLGRFTIASLPAGSQVAEVRRLGYPRARALVELRRGRTASVTIQLNRIVSLDSVRVVAQRMRLNQFEDRRQKNQGFGKFLGPEEIAKRNPFYTSDLLRAVPGIQVTGSGMDAVLLSTRGNLFGGGSCPINVVIDGMTNMDINMVDPRDVAGIEVYPGEVGLPQQFAGLSNSLCGTVIVWTKR